METTIMRYIGIILGFVLGLYRDNGKENGHYYLGLKFYDFKAEAQA